MRSLRSGRVAEINIATKSKKATKKGEITINNKMCNKRSKPGKAETRKARPVLADKTNSDLDTNNSSNNLPIENKRPKRSYNLPARLKDHQLTPPKKFKTECSTSTPIKKHNGKTECTKFTTLQKETPAKTSLVSKSKSKNAKEKNISSSIPLNKSSILTSVLTPAERGKLGTTATPIYKRGLKEPEKDNNDPEVKKISTPLYKKKIVLLEKPKIQTPDRIALYEFDFDPSEEPTAQNKKKKNKKKTASKKKVNKIDTNAKDDEDLQELIEKLKRIQEKQKCKKLLEKKKAMQILKDNERSKDPIPTVNIETFLSTDNNNDQNMMECLSPIPRHISKSPQLNNNSQVKNNLTSDGQTNLLSVSPIASSSMILNSARKPAGSPWRVDGGDGIRKWPLNFHVKPSMTPSYDRDTRHVIGLSNTSDSIPNERRHVYTNISINSSHGEEEQKKKVSSLRQTSILSFYEESMRKSAKKRLSSPKKHIESYNFDELVPQTNDLSNTLSQSIESDKNKDNLDNCFGFDDSTEFDQENVNVSPAKLAKLQNINTVRGAFKGTKKHGGILKEINQNKDKNLPMRVLPSEIINIIEKQKFMEDIDEPREEPAVDQFPQLMSDNNLSNDSDDEIMAGKESLPMENSQSNEVQLFDEPIDPDFVHFSKPTRRSYETRKRPHLTFLLSTTSKDKSDESDYSTDDESHISVAKVKKVVKRKKKQSAKTKKEEKKIDEWAAGFNSMLEEVEDFSLCVE